MSVEWFDICCLQEIRRGALIESELTDHSDWIANFLHDARFCHDFVGGVVRLHGHLPKSFDGLAANPELKGRK